MKRTLIALAFLLTLTAAATEDVWDGVTGAPPAREPDSAAGGPEIFGPVAVFSAPRSVLGLSTIVNFDDARHHDPVNTRYADVGIGLQRDDGRVVHAYDFCGCGHQTSSPPMVACTTRGPGAPTIASALNLVFDADIRTAGFFVGNDCAHSQHWTIEVFDAEDTMIGRLGFMGNCNVSADEFIGVTSAVPFRRLRLSHNFSRYAVCVDDVVFSPLSMTAN